MNPEPKKESQAGFTIVELVVAMIVGTAFIITTNLAISNYAHLATRDRQLTLANSFVEGETEALRNSGYNSLNIGTTDITGQLPAALQAPKSATLNISYPGGDASGGIKQIDVSVNYTDQTSKSYSYTTYIGELGVGQ